GSVQRDLRRGVGGCPGIRHCARDSGFRNRSTTERAFAGSSPIPDTACYGGEIMPPITRRQFAVVAAASAVALTGTAQTPIDDDAILRAMRDEMERSRQLRVVGGGDDVPYYICYTLTDSNDFQVSAEMGAAVTAGRNHYRIPSVEV